MQEEEEEKKKKEQQMFNDYVETIFEDQGVTSSSLKFSNLETNIDHNTAT